MNLVVSGGVALQQTKGHGTAQRIDDQIDLRIGTQFSSFDRSPQHQPCHLSAPLGEFREEGRTCFRVDLCLCDQSDQGRAGNGPRLEVDDGVGDAFQIVGDVAGVGIVQLSRRHLQVQVHAQRGFGRPAAVDGGLGGAAIEGDAFHRQAGVAVAAQDASGGGEHAVRCACCARDFRGCGVRRFCFRPHLRSIRYVAFTLARMT